MLDRVFALRRIALALFARLDWLPPLLARVAIGVVFVQSGWGKLHDLPKVIEFFTELGIPHPELQAPFAAGTELVCGALVLAGLVTRLASVPLIAVMTVAIVTAIWPDLDGFSDLYFKGEFLFIVLLIGLVLRGPGAVSLDALLLRALGRDRSAASAAPALRRATA